MNREADIRALCQNLQALMQKKNWSGHKFVDECIRRETGLNERTVRDAIDGKKLPKKGTQQIFAEVLGVTVPDLFSPNPNVMLQPSQSIPVTQPNGTNTYADFSLTAYGDLEARALSDEEFRLFLEIDSTAYGLEGYDNEFLARWRSCYPNGCIGLFDQSMLIGGVGIWPLSAAVSSSLSSGMYQNEAQISCLPQDAARTSRWYLGGLLIAEAHRMKGYLAPLIGHCLSVWLDECKDDIVEPIELLAVLVHRKLHTKFDRWGFQRQCGLFQGRFPIMMRRFLNRQAFRVWLETEAVPDLTSTATRR